MYVGQFRSVDVRFTSIQNKWDILIYARPVSRYSSTIDNLFSQQTYSSSVDVDIPVFSSKSWLTLSLGEKARQAFKSVSRSTGHSSEARFSAIALCLVVRTTGLP